MSVYKRKDWGARTYSRDSLSDGRAKFTSPLALGLCSAVPSAKDPVDAIIRQARSLILESGLTKPPFRPSSFAHLRKVTAIVKRDLKVEGRLLPCDDGFIIELRKDRPHERTNFTCAHEIAHTFFYEAVPTIKYRAITADMPLQDPEEEMLCNIAAAEMLMPKSVFSKIATEQPESPHALLGITRLFETSITATIIRLQRLRVWGGTYVLWRKKEEGFVANWIAQPSRGLTYYPPLRIVNDKESSVYRTFVTGEDNSNEETLVFDNGYKPCRLHSVRLESSDKVLSCFGCPAIETPRVKEALEILPLDYDCECDGTGWRTIIKYGRSYVARCHASSHRRSQPLVGRKNYQDQPDNDSTPSPPLFTKSE